MDADRSQQRSDKLASDKDSVIAAKNKEIEQLKSQMEDMAQEFGDMLKASLTLSVDVLSRVHAFC